MLRAIPGQRPERSAGKCLDQGIASARRRHLGARRHSLGRSRKKPKSDQRGNARINADLHIIFSDKALFRRGAGTWEHASTSRAIPGGIPGATPRAIPGTTRREVPRARHYFVEVRQNHQHSLGHSRANLGSDPWGTARNNPQRTPRSKAWLLRGGPS